jgi:hypothetical protein
MSSRNVLTVAVAFVVAGWVLAAPQAGHAGVYPGNKCFSAKMKSAGKYCMSVLKAWSVWDKTQDDDKRNDKLTKAKTKLDDGWSKAETKAADKGVDCVDMTVTSDELALMVGTATAEIVAEINDGLDLGDKDDGKCGSKFIEAAAKKCSGFLKAESKFIKMPEKDPDNVKLHEGKDKASDKFDDAWLKAEALGCIAGTSAAAIEELVDEATEDVVLATTVNPVGDYFSAPFEVHRALDWGERPDWSPDGDRLAFTESDTEESYAYELDLHTGEVRCLTCQWGLNGLVTRIYYLPDNSFLILAGPDVVNTELYWMPASLSMPPQSLNVTASGEVAISRQGSRAGGFRIAWGAFQNSASQMLTGEIVHDGSRADLSNLRVVYEYPLNSPPPQPGDSLATFAETYNFAKHDKAVTFWTIERTTVNGEMYELDLRTGALTNLYPSPWHNETHLFPDERFGLEESNRASDPNGPFRGVSGLPADFLALVLLLLGVEDPPPDPNDAGRPFDLFLVAIDGSERVRRLTHVSDIGGQAHQSAPAPDGRRVAFALQAPSSGPFAGKDGLYVGEFNFTWVSSTENMACKEDDYEPQLSF